MNEAREEVRVWDLLDRSAREARRRWNRRFPGSVSEGALESSMELLGSALDSAPGEPIEPELRDPPSMLTVRRTLLDLWRAAFADALGREPGGEDRTDAHLARFLRFEEVRSALEPDWDEQIESALSGPRAHHMLAEIGHDLRSPLTSILFLSEVLKDSAGIREDDRQVRQLGLIYSGALTMLNIVNNFMELARSGEGPSDPAPTVFSLSDLMESTRRTVQPMADEKGLELEVSHRPIGSERRTGHPVALSRILLNLITNALKFTQSGRVEMAITEPAPGLLEFSVSDTGPGIDPEKEASIFQVFEPAQDRHGVHFSGTGLGLVIVRRLLRELGSELVCDSKPGEGTRMSFRIRMDLPPG